MLPNESMNGSVVSVKTVAVAIPKDTKIAILLNKASSPPKSKVKKPPIIPRALPMIDL